MPDLMPLAYLEGHPLLELLDLWRTSEDHLMSLWPDYLVLTLCPTLCPSHIWKAIRSWSSWAPNPAHYDPFCSSLLGLAADRPWLDLSGAQVHRQTSGDRQMSFNP